MPRKIVIKQSTYPYHVYNRSIDRSFFDVPMPTLWRIFSEQAYSVSMIWNAHIHSLVLMGNHYHMLISTPDANISDCMCDFQSEIARQISLWRGSDGYRFQSRYGWSIINTRTSFHSVWKYVYQNPLAAGLCDTTVQYPYSSLHALDGNSELAFPIKICALAPELFDRPISEYTNWLNNAYSREERERIRKGLKKETYAPALGKSTHKKRSELETKQVFVPVLTQCLHEKAPGAFI